MKLDTTTALAVELTLNLVNSKCILEYIQEYIRFCTCRLHMYTRTYAYHILILIA